MFSNAIKDKRTESSFQSPQPAFSRLNPVIVTGLCSEEQNSCLNLPQRPQPFSGANWVGLTRYRDDEEGGGPRVTESEMGESEMLECGQAYPEDSDETFYHDFDAPKSNQARWKTPVAAKMTAAQLSGECRSLSSPGDQSGSSAQPAVAVETVKMFKCSFPNCLGMFSRKDLLKRHHKTVHSGKKIKCNECSRVFRDKSDLKRHKRSFHRTSPFSCNVAGCGKAFASSEGLKMYKMHHQGTLPFQCFAVGCGKGFAHKHLLEGHMVCHTGTKQEECAKCLKKFAYKHNLARHMKKC